MNIRILRVLSQFRNKLMRNKIKKNRIVKEKINMILFKSQMIIINTVKRIVIAT